jgi:rfaE bifunctional protein nucleotidyltransferase chain/domain
MSTESATAETYDRGIFGIKSNPEARFVENHLVLGKQIDACKVLGLKIVLTSGSFDMLHIGHARYLERAKEYGDVLVVGVDSDEKVRVRKGPDRPVVPEHERVQMLAHIRAVDFLTLKQPGEPKWDLIERLRPDTLVVTTETYTQNVLRELGRICGRVVALEPQATTSTSAQIRRILCGQNGNFIK